MKRDRGKYRNIECITDSHHTTNYDLMTNFHVQFQENHMFNSFKYSMYKLTNKTIWTYFKFLLRQNCHIKIEYEWKIMWIFINAFCMPTENFKMCYFFLLPHFTSLSHCVKQSTHTHVLFLVFEAFKNTSNSLFILSRKKKHIENHWKWTT